MPSYPSLYLGTTPVIRTPLGSLDSPWVRPTQWPILLDTTNKDIFVGLLAVENTDANHIALLATTSTGTYHVNWGDGTLSAACTSNTQAEKSYTYSSLAGYPEWNGYRLVQVTLSANTGNLAAVSTQRKASSGALSALPAGMNVNWLEMDINIPTATNLTIGTNINVTMGLLQSVKIRRSNITANAASLFRECYSLQNAELPGLSACTACSELFYNCYDLKYAPELNTSNSTNFANMFRQCYNLQSIPRYNTSNGTNFSNMFNNCKQLQAIPLLDTGKGTNFASMFLGCNSLLTIPLLNTLSGTDFSSMFNTCNSLVTIPAIDTRNGTTFSSMFNTCGSLKYIPYLDTGKANDFSNMFTNDVALVSVPALDTKNSVTTNSMFNSCYSLTGVPDLDTRKVTNAISMFIGCQSMVKSPTIVLSAATNIDNLFSGCISLTEIPTLDLRSASATTTQTQFATCRSLSKSGVTNLNRSHSYANCRLSRDAIVTIFNNLSAVGGAAPTITITGNYGALSLTAGDRAIATGKNWAISG